MHAVADTNELVADGVITPEQAREIEARARDTMMALAINAVLSFGIIAATGGLIFYLADAVAVAIVGALALAAGLMVLARGGALYRMFGNAAALIGAGLLLGGSVVELAQNHPDIASMAMVIFGAAVAAAAALGLARLRLTAGFVTGAILVMGVAMHLGGLGLWAVENELSGWPVSMVYLYMALAIGAVGLWVDVRLLTALAIVPFAQMLDTGTLYFHAAYVFYSPEPTLSILQMAVLVLVAIWVKNRAPERIARHARLLSVMGLIVANLCALVGSLWGDVVGSHLWGPGFRPEEGQDWESFEAIRDAFEAQALVISDGVYSVIWAVALVGVIALAAHRANRGIFNTALTFAAIHAYTQLFESFGDEPLAYVVGGLAAIPLAWGMWRLNGWLAARGAVPPKV
jgi:hypothetical protein